ncbi:homeobox-leucine zipper protein ROC8-like isoform X1 [Nicotiana tabacum]|uniref:Homeobox-leucine zipper protein ROC8-like isoform X1 n=1 Tax=Nicotiana tabacum TaxID=4097 RepID=A0AC58SAG2_TOBAC
MDSPSGSSSDEQIQKLEEVFSQTPNPENDVIEKLSEELGLDTNHVKIWFDNKRCYIQAQRDKEEGENLRLENSRLLSENLQMSLELRNRLCATCNPEKQRKLLQDLQNENAILQTEVCACGETRRAFTLLLCMWRDKVGYVVDIFVMTCDGLGALYVVDIYDLGLRGGTSGVPFLMIFLYGLAFG